MEKRTTFTENINEDENVFSIEVDHSDAELKYGVTFSWSDQLWLTQADVDKMTKVINAAKRCAKE